MKDICPICGIGDYVDRHHIIPRSFGGSNSQSNLINICKLCHKILHTGVKNPATSETKALQEARLIRLEKIRYFYNNVLGIKAVIGFYGGRFHLLNLPMTPTNDRYSKFIEALDSHGLIFRESLLKLNEVKK